MVDDSGTRSSIQQQVEEYKNKMRGDEKSLQVTPDDDSLLSLKDDSIELIRTTFVQNEEESQEQQPALETQPFEYPDHVDVDVVSKRKRSGQAISSTTVATTSFADIVLEASIIAAADELNRTMIPPNDALHADQIVDHDNHMNVKKHKKAKMSTTTTITTSKYFEGPNHFLPVEGDSEVEQNMKYREKKKGKDSMSEEDSLQLRNAPSEEGNRLGASILKEESEEKANRDKMALEEKADTDKIAVEERVKEMEEMVKEMEVALKKANAEKIALKKANAENIEALKKANAEKLALKKANAENIEALKKAEEKIIESEERDSIKKMLEVGIPKMIVNPSTKPSMTKNDEARKIMMNYYAQLAEYRKKNRKDAPKKYKFHEPAQIIVQKIDPNGLTKININTKNKNGALIRSPLAIEAERTAMVNKNKLPHHNETNPQDYLSFVLKDVMACCGLDGVSVVKEATLFSLRPDLIVVLFNGRLLLVVEVKNPTKQEFSKDLFEVETVAGQTLDYLKILKQQGIDWPFALLSTYNDSVIVWLSGDEDKYQKIMDEGFVNANGRNDSAIRQKLATFPQNEKPQFSPQRDAFCQKVNHFSPTAENAPTAENVSDDDDSSCCESTDDRIVNLTNYDYMGRKVVYSQSFSADHIYKLVTLALEFSLVSFSKSAHPENPSIIPEEGTSLDGEYCTLNSESFSYKNVSIQNLTFLKPPQPSMKYCHLICQLGQGTSGKTILCSSSKGKLFVVKLFLPTVSTKYTEKDRDEENKDELSRLTEVAKAECKRWHELEPQYQSYCRFITLNSLPAITMPFFSPIRFEDRASALDPIKDLLKKVANDNKLYYQQEDLRWRHFGCRNDGDQMKFTLLDLGSMNNEVLSIDKQVAELRERMGEKPPEPKVVMVRGGC